MASSHNVLQVYQLAIQKNRVLASRARSANAPLRVAVLQRAHWESLRRHSDARRAVADRTLRRRSPLHTINTSGEEAGRTVVAHCAGTVTEATTDVGAISIVEVTATTAPATTTTPSMGSESSPSQATVGSRSENTASWSGECHGNAVHPKRRGSDVEYDGERPSRSSEEHHLDLSHVAW